MRCFKAKSSALIFRESIFVTVVSIASWNYNKSKSLRMCFFKCDLLNSWNTFSKVSNVCTCCWTPSTSRIVKNRHFSCESLHMTHVYEAHICIGLYSHTPRKFYTWVLTAKRVFREFVCSAHRWYIGLDCNNLLYVSGNIGSVWRYANRINSSKYSTYALLIVKIAILVMIDRHAHTHAYNFALTRLESNMTWISYKIHFFSWVHVFCSHT